MSDKFAEVQKEIEQIERFEQHKQKSVMNLVSALNNHVEGIKSKSSFRNKIVEKLNAMLDSEDLDPVMLIKMYEIAEKAEEGSSKFLTDVIRSMQQKDDTSNPLLPDQNDSGAMKKPVRDLTKEQQKKLKEVYDAINKSENG